MLTSYVLSYDSYQWIDNEKLFIYRWVRVQPFQIKKGMSVLKALPSHKTGELIHYSVEDRGNLLFKVLGDGRLRELSSKEKKNPGIAIKI